MKTLIILATFFLSPYASNAQLRFKNQTLEEVSVAIGYCENGEWYVEGWSKISPQTTQPVYKKSLSHRYYYYYAWSTKNIWAGSDNFYIATFGPLLKIAQSGSHGKQLELKKIDVGKSPTFTVNLLAYDNFVTKQVPLGSVEEGGNPFQSDLGLKMEMPQNHTSTDF